MSEEDRAFPSTVDIVGDGRSLEKSWRLGIETLPTLIKDRAGEEIGRALQLIIRNVGGGKPGGVDRSTLGNPGKYSFCFTEREADSCRESPAVENGFDAGTSTVA